MASTISGASLANIYNRLNNAPTYHPLDANTFADWSIEAGDIVTITRGANTRSAEGAESYQSPVMTSKLVWKGTPQIALNSSGNKEREAVSKISRRKYGRGAGMNNDVGIHSYVYNTESTIYSYIDQTATYITQGVEDVANQLGSAILQTASQIRSEVHAANSQLYSYIDETATYISSHVEDVANDLGSEILQTASQIRSEVHASNSQLYSYVDQTATYINQVVANTASGLRSSINQQANRIGLVVDGTGADAKIKAAEIALSISADGSNAYIGADHITLSGNTLVEDGHFRVKDNLAMFGTNLANLVTIASGDITANRYDYKDSSTGTAVGMLKKAAVDPNTNTLKIWKFGDDDDSPSINFSKATSLSGAWSGNKLTVTASPQNVKYETYVGTDIGPIQDETGYFMYPNYWTPTAIQPVAITDAKKQLTIEDVSDDVVRLMKDSTSTGLVYYHGKYTAGVSAGRQSVTPSISWPVGWTVTASNPYDNTKTASIGISMSHGSDSTGHYIELHSDETSAPLKAKKTISLNTGSVSSGSRTVKVNFDGSDILSATISDYSNGQSAAGISTSWGTGSGANVLTVERALSSDTKSATFTVTAGAPTGSYNSSTHKYVLTGTALVNNTQRATGSGGTGTEASDDGVSAGKSAAGISTSWGTGSGANVLTVERALSSSTKSATFTVTAGNPTYSYNSSTHKYALTGTALVNSSQKASGVSSTGTEAYDAGVSAGKSAAGISTSWGTGSGANVLTVERALSSSTKSATFTVTAGNPTYSYNSSTHKYALTGTALVNNTHRASGVSSTGTEAYDGGYSDGNSAGYSSGYSAGYGNGKTDGANSAGNSAWFHYASGAGSNHQGTLSANSYVSIGYVNAAGTTIWKDDTTWLTPNGGGTTPSASNIDLNSPEWMWDSAWTSLPSSDARRSAVELTTIKNLIRDNHGQGRAGWLLFRATYNGGTGAKWYRINTQWA